MTEAFRIYLSIIIVITISHIYFIRIEPSVVVCMKLISKFLFCQRNLHFFAVEIFINTNKWQF